MSELSSRAGSPHSSTSAASEAPARAAARIRLMQCVTLFGCGGTARHFANLGLALDDQRFAVEYACLRQGSHDLSELDARGVPLSDFPILSLLGPGALRQQVRLARHIASRRIQIVHSSNYYSNVFAIPAAWAAGAPVIIASIGDHDSSLTPLQRRVQRMVCRLSDCVVVKAESVKEWLVADGYDRSSIGIIRNGVDLPTCTDRWRGDVRRELGIPEDLPVVTMVTRFSVKQGIEDFIDAAAIVSWNCPQGRFLIAGEGHRASRGTVTEDLAYRQMIVSRIRRLGLQDRVFLTGCRADVGSLLSNAAISVLPSPGAGLSQLLLESMAAGVPVVATRVGGTSEAVVHGETGLLVPPGDPQELAEAIGSLLRESDLADRLGAAGRQVMRERFGMDRMAHATEQLYLDLLVRKAAQPGWRGRVGLCRPAFEPLPGQPREH